MAKKSYYIFAIATITLLTTFLHFTAMGEFSPYVVFEELFYLPLLLGVLRFGLRGAIVTWLFVSAAYLPFFFPPLDNGFSRVCGQESSPHPLSGGCRCCRTSF